jgi:hypothetical protein
MSHARRCRVIKQANEHRSVASYCSCSCPFEQRQTGVDHSIAGFSHTFLLSGATGSPIAPAQELIGAGCLARMQPPSSPLPRCAFGIAEVIVWALGRSEEHDSVTTVASLKPFQNGPAKIVRTGERSVRSHRHIPATNLTGETLCSLLREQRTIVKQGRTTPSQSSVLSFRRSRPMSLVVSTVRGRHAARQAGPTPKVSLSSDLERVVMLAKIYLVTIVALTMALGPPSRGVRIPLPVGGRDGRRRQPDAR